MENKLKYLIVEDSYKVCQGIKERMDDFQNWEKCPFAHHVDDAVREIKMTKPELIYLDWALKGGSAYDVLYCIENIQEYDPYIIFNTGYQSENPEIPQEIINNYKVDKYLVKPLWENLRNNLSIYLKEAEEKSRRRIAKMKIWITDIEKRKHHINLLDIICIQQHFNNPYHKIIFCINEKSVITKLSWSQFIQTLNNYNIDFFITNSRQHLIIKNYIDYYNRPYVKLINYKHKLEVVKNKLSEFEKWIYN